MISDSNQMNRHNPYVADEFSLPGTSRKIQDIEGGAQIARVDYDDETLTHQSIMCDYASTAGDRTVDMCTKTAPNCSLSRELVPGRNIDWGFTKKVVENVKHNVKVLNERTCGFGSPVVLFIIFILVLWILRR